MLSDLFSHLFLLHLGGHRVRGATGHAGVLRELVEDQLEGRLDGVGDLVSLV